MFRSLVLGVLVVSTLAACDNKDRSRNGGVADIPGGGQMSQSDLNGEPADLNGRWIGNALAEVNGAPNSRRTVVMRIDQTDNSLNFSTHMIDADRSDVVVNDAQFEIDRGDLINLDGREVGQIGRGGFQTRNVPRVMSFRLRNHGNTANLTIRYMSRSGAVRITAVMNRRDHRPEEPSHHRPRTR
jgi:hypothetical protein